MKWYSVKEYTPPACNNVIVRVIKTDGYTYDRFYIAMCEDFDTIDDIITWNLDNACDHKFDFRDYTVTHFALIEPVPIWRGE